MGTKMWLVDGDEVTPVLVDEGNDEGYGAFDEKTGIYFTAHEWDLFATEDGARQELDKRRKAREVTP
jgi:hypothetical protein